MAVALLCTAWSSSALAAFILCWERAAWMSSLATFALHSAPWRSKALCTPHASGSSRKNPTALSASKEPVKSTYLEVWCSLVLLITERLFPAAVHNWLPAILLARHGGGCKMVPDMVSSLVLWQLAGDLCLEGEVACISSPSR